MKDLYTKKYRTLMKKKIKMQIIYTNNAHELEELTSIRCLYYLKQSTDSIEFISKFQ